MKKISMRIDYKLSDKFDFILFWTITALVVIGILAIYSSTQNAFSEKNNFEKQIVSWVISLIFFFIVFLLPTAWIRAAAIPTYIISLLFLILVLVIGKSAGGAKSWIQLGPFSFQPSEFAKVATILFLANFLSREGSDIDSLKDILFSLVIGFTPVFLILLEPDLGSSIVFFGIILLMLFWKGISLFGLIIVLSPGIVAVAALLGLWYVIGAMILLLFVLFKFKKDLFTTGAIVTMNIASAFLVDFVYDILSPHQQRRIDSFIDPSADPLGSGYNAIQAQVAIGSGGLFGKGFLQGNQTQLQFIPEQWTDFIFCVIGEEFGFIGSIIILGLFGILFFRIFRVAINAKDEFLSLVCIGILSLFFIHVAINLGMAIGLLPVIGIPLPFISYGGTSLLINMMMVGIILNIYRTRKDYT